MVYACFTKYQSAVLGKGFWRFEYLAFSDREKELFEAIMTEKMQSRMLGIQPIGYRTILLDTEE